MFEARENTGWMEARRLMMLILGILGIIILDVGFISSTGPDLFYFTPALPNPQVAYLLLRGVNTVLAYLLGAGFLGTSIIGLILTDAS